MVGGGFLESGNWEVNFVVDKPYSGALWVWLQFVFGHRVCGFKLLVNISESKWIVRLTCQRKF